MRIAVACLADPGGDLAAHRAGLVAGEGATMWRSVAARQVPVDAVVPVVQMVGKDSW